MYNRSLDLMAIATAAVKAGLPEKAATYLQAAARDPGADAAMSAIFAANKKKKKKARASASALALRSAFGAEEEEGFEEVDKDDSEVSGIEEEDDEDTMRVTDSVASLRAALEGTQDETIEDMTRDEEADGFDETTPKVTARRKATATKVGNERFARTLRNLAAARR